LKILICGDSFKRISGLSYVTLNFAKYFAQKKYEITYVVITGEKCDINDLKNKDHDFYKILSKMKVIYIPNKADKSYDIFNNTIKESTPDLVFSCHDLWQFENIAFSLYRETYKWIAYCPVESDYYSDYIIYPTSFDKSARKSLANICENIDYIIPYNSAGYIQLSKLKGNVLEPIPNGLDEYIFKEEEMQRKNVFKGIVKDDDFLFMTVGHNFQRKGLDYVVEAFHTFLNYFPSEDRHKYKLYIHGFLDTIDAGTDIKSMIYYLGLNNNVLMSQNEQISKKDLYARYRCADCYIGLPLAEGFGYGFMEAQLNGLPIIYHNVGGISQYINPENFAVSSISNMYPNNYYCKWKIPNIKEAVNTMLRIACEPNIITDELKQNNINTSKKYLWKNIYKKLDDMLNLKSMVSPNIINKLHIRRIV
jgi:glycosyltransferase involved in cell wall biosynthesis